MDNLIRGYDLITVPCIHHVREPAVKGHFLLDIEVFSEDGVTVIVWMNVPRVYCNSMDERPTGLL